MTQTEVKALDQAIKILQHLKQDMRVARTLFDKGDYEKARQHVDYARRYYERTVNE